jgi:hypothetical protein
MMLWVELGWMVARVGTGSCLKLSTRAGEHFVVSYSITYSINSALLSRNTFRFPAITYRIF